jgi:hypothetical protein
MACKTQVVRAVVGDRLDGRLGTDRQRGRVARGAPRRARAVVRTLGRAPGEEQVEVRTARRLVPDHRGGAPRGVGPPRRAVGLGLERLRGVGHADIIPQRCQEGT